MLSNTKRVSIVNSETRHSSIGPRPPRRVRDATLQPHRGPARSRITPCLRNGVKPEPSCTRLGCKPPTEYKANYYASPRDGQPANPT